VTLDEPHAKLDLEPPDLGGQARLGDPQPLGRAREAALIGDRPKYRS
jgi:hypothetical protein